MKKIIVTAALLGSLAMAVPVSATEADELTGNPVFDMSTDYPGIYAKPGDQTSFGLDFLNTTGESLDASLSITDIPDNWEGFFKGKTGEISKVHVANAYDASEDLATFSLTIPGDAAEGGYDITLEAEADNGTKDTVVLAVTVSQQENGASTYTAEYPQQQAPSGTKFTFKTVLANNKGVAQSYTLSSRTQEGWQVTFTPEGASAPVASMELEPGTSKEISVEIVPPETLTEGEYTIPVSAISSTETLEADLDLTITGQYDVELTTSDGRLSFDAYADDEKTMTLSIVNTGNVDLTNLTLLANAPADWNVTFDESEIDILEAGATRNVTMNVTPAKDSMTGDYVTSVTVNNSTVKASADFRVSVKTRTTWGLAAAGIIVVLLGILGAVCKKYGRR